MCALWSHTSFSYHFTQLPSLPGSRVISASLQVKIKAHRASYAGQSFPPVMGGICGRGGWTGLRCGMTWDSRTEPATGYKYLAGVGAQGWHWAKTPNCLQKPNSLSSSNGGSSFSSAQGFLTIA